MFISVASVLVPNSMSISVGSLACIGVDSGGVSVRIY